MTIDNLEAVLYTLVFLVPGFIMYSTFSLFAVRKSEPSKELLLLRFLAFSTANLIIDLPLLYPVIAKKWITTAPLVAALALFIVTFVSPMLLGLAAAWLDKVDGLRRSARKIGLTALHPVPTAWDYKFGLLSSTSGRWVKVELKDGRCIGGFYGNNSFASTEPTERDIYLEAVYEVPADGSHWQEVERTDGILIRFDDIRNVSFLFDRQQVAEMEQFATQAAQRQSVRAFLGRLVRWSARPIQPTVGAGNGLSADGPERGTSEQASVSDPERSLDMSDPYHDRLEKVVVTDTADTITKGHQPQNVLPSSQRTPPGGSAEPATTTNPTGTTETSGSAPQLVQQITQQGGE